MRLRHIIKSGLMLYVHCVALLVMLPYENSESCLAWYDSGIVEEKMIL